MLRDRPRSQGFAIWSQSSRGDVGCDKPRIDDRDTHSVLFQLEPERVEEARHCVFGSRVERSFWNANAPCEAGHGHDASVRSLEVRERVPRAMDAAKVVDPRDPL